MSKVITFSRVFPTTHPRKGEPTHFVEKILTSLKIAPADMSDDVKSIIHEFAYFCGDYQPKKHTIREGKRWKAGDVFSPRVWSGKPYASKQIVIAPDITIARVADISIIDVGEGCLAYTVDGICLRFEQVQQLAQNDGLTVRDLHDWFVGKKIFSGQVLIWDDRDLSY